MAPTLPVTKLGSLDPSDRYDADPVAVPPPSEAGRAVLCGRPEARDTARRDDVAALRRASSGLVLPDSLLAGTSVNDADDELEVGCFLDEVLPEVVLPETAIRLTGLLVAETDNFPVIAGARLGCPSESTVSP